MNKKTKMTKVCLEMKDPAEAKKKQDMLSKARNKLLNLSEALKHNKSSPSDDLNLQKPAITKSMTQCTLDYFFKNSNKEKNHHVYANTHGKILQKQNSVGSYPIRIEISSEDDYDVTDVCAINRLRPATVCVDKPSEMREAEALALERPRKKLSFREPEVMKFNGIKDKSSKGQNTLQKSVNNGQRTLKKCEKKSLSPQRLNRNLSVSSCMLNKTPSFDDTELESQAMRVVRTIGQAFEVCHKLSITAPEQDNSVDQDEQDTLTQDLLSDRFSDAPSDKPKKDFILEGASDKHSLPPDDSSLKDSYLEHNGKHNRLPQLDILPPPPNNSTRKTPLSSAETYAAPHSDHLGGGGPESNAGSGSGTSLPPAGGALSAHHELQLMREQLEQQSQQTQAAVAQLQLAREQLAAEQSARLEAQARTHQLLVHNRELLDHIAALVAHLQGGDKTGQQQTPPHMTMPQQLLHSVPGDSTNYPQDLSETTLDNASICQALGLTPQGLIENRAVASCLPSSPLRTSFNPGNGVFNFSYPPPMESACFETQLLQRLQSLSGFNPPSQFGFVYNQPNTMSYLYNQAMLNNNYTLQPPPQKKVPAASSYATLPRYTGNPVEPSRNSEPRQMPPSQYQSQQNLAPFQTQYLPQSNQNLNISVQDMRQPQYSNNHTNQYQSQTNQSQLQVNQDLRQQRCSSPKPQNTTLEGQYLKPPSQVPQNGNLEGQFIKPLSQMGTLTTTDAEGRVRVIVPVPSNSGEEAGSLLANLRIRDDLRVVNGPGITRSTSEKVPNRSEMMSEVQRTAWARHTTK